MEARVKRLEDDVRAMRGDLTTIIGRLSAVEGKLDTLLTQVVGKVPSGLQMSRHHCRYTGGRGDDLQQCLGRGAVAQAHSALNRAAAGSPPG